MSGSYPARASQQMFRKNGEFFAACPVGDDSDAESGMAGTGDVVRCVTDDDFACGFESASVVVREAFGDHSRKVEAIACIGPNAPMSKSRREVSPATLSLTPAANRRLPVSTVWANPVCSTPRAGRPEATAVAVTMDLWV